jgi:hypothetical protein
VANRKSIRKEAFVACLMVLFWLLLGETEEKHVSSVAKIKLGTSKTQVRHIRELICYKLQQSNYRLKCRFGPAAT